VFVCTNFRPLRFDEGSELATADTVVLEPAALHERTLRGAPDAPSRAAVGLKLRGDTDRVASGNGDGLISGSVTRFRWLDEDLADVGEPDETKVECESVLP
jgi:hypothetical protein